MTRHDILAEIRMLAGPGPGQLPRAWALAWRAVRFLERAAETARRNRLAELDPGGPTPVGEPVKFIAARCLRLAVPARVEGEAAVVAAVENAVDTARSVSSILYDEYVAAHEKASEATLRDPRRLALLRARKSVSIVRAERFLTTTGDER